MVLPPVRLNGEPGTAVPLIVTEIAAALVALITNASLADVPTMYSTGPTKPAGFTVTAKLPVGVAGDVRGRVGDGRRAHREVAARGWIEDDREQPARHLRWLRHHCR